MKRADDSGPHNTHNCNSSWTDSSMYSPYWSLTRARSCSYPSHLVNGAVFCSNHHHIVRTLKVSILLSECPKIAKVEYLLYRTQPSEMYRLRPYLAIKKKINQQDYLSLDCVLIAHSLSCCISFEVPTQPYVPHL